MTTEVRQWRCKICGKDRDYKTRARLVAHIQKTDLLPFVTSKTLEEWNIPRAEVKAKLRSQGDASSSSSADPEPAPAPAPTGGRLIASWTKAPKPAPVQDGEEETIPDWVMPGEEDAFFKGGFDSDGTTLDRYLEFMKEEREETIQYLSWHATRLSKCVAILTTGGYLVKQLSLSDGKVVYNQMSKKSLVALMETLTIQLSTQTGQRREISLANLLNKPQVCMGLNKYRAVDFYSDDPNVFNLWRGFAYEPAPKGTLNMGLIQPFLDHIKEVICSGHEDVYQHELKKLGWAFQNPNDHLGFATVLLSEEGTGKSTYTDFICSLWGSEWAEPNITNMEMITEINHAEAIALKKWIVANEIRDMEGNRGSWDVMKSRITDDFYRVKLIYQATRVVRNVNNYYLCTNNLFSIKMGPCDRRYQIIQVSSGHRQDVPYFTALRASLTPEMKSHFLRFLLDMDLTGFDPRLPPISEIKKEIQEAQKPTSEIFLENFDWKDQHGFERAKDGLTYQELYRDGFLKFCDEFGVPERYRAGIGRFSLEIRNLVDQRTEGGRRMYYPKGGMPEGPVDEVKIGGQPFKKIDPGPASIVAFTQAERRAQAKVQTPPVPNGPQRGPEGGHALPKAAPPTPHVGRVRKPAQAPPPESLSSPGSGPAGSPPQ